MQGHNNITMKSSHKKPRLTESFLHVLCTPYTLIFYVVKTRNNMSIHFVFQVKFFFYSRSRASSVTF